MHAEQQLHSPLAHSGGGINSEGADAELLLTPVEWNGAGVPDVVVRLSAQVAVDMLQLCQAHTPEGRAAITVALREIYKSGQTSPVGREGYSTMTSALDLVRDVGRMQLHARGGEGAAQDTHAPQQEETHASEEGRVRLSGSAHSCIESGCNTLGGAEKTDESTHTTDLRNDEQITNNAVADDERDMIHQAQLCVGRRGLLYHTI